MVTRTVDVVEAEVMTLNVTTAEVSYNNYKLTGSYDESEILLKDLKKVYETADVKLCAIRNIHYSTVLYGMPESKFIELAEVLPPR